jgi:hypothetical protein
LICKSNQFAHYSSQIQFVRSPPRLSPATSPSYLTPGEAIELANLRQPIKIASHDESRALATIVTKVAADWIAASAGDEPDSTVDVTSQYTKVGSPLIPRAFIASKPHWAVFPNGKLLHFQRKVANHVARSKVTTAFDDGAEGDSPL